MSEGDVPPDGDLTDRDPQFVERIRREIEVWRTEGIISSEVAETLAGRYGVAADDGRPFALNRLSAAIVIFGAILVGLGIIAVLAANWDAISDVAKIGLMVAASTTAYVAGWLLAYRFETPRTGIALILLGAIIYGASIHLIAQAFNVEVNHPLLMPAWFLGVVPIAYVTRSVAILVLSLILLLVSLGFRMQVWFDEEFANSDEGAVFMLVVAAYVLFGAVLFALGRLHARWGSYQHFARYFDVFGIGTAAVGTYALSFASAWRTIDRVALRDFEPEFWITFVVVVTVATLALAVAYKRRETGADDSVRWLWIASGTIVMVGIAITTWIALIAYASWFWIPVNVIILISIIAMLTAGFRFNRAYLVNTAFIMFGVTVMTRYFEFGFDLLDQGLAFIVTGILLLAIGFGLERLRRGMIRDMRERVPAP